MKPSEKLREISDERVNSDLEYIWTELCRLECVNLDNHEHVKSQLRKIRHHLTNFTKDYYEFPDHILPRSILL